MRHIAAAVALSLGTTLAVAPVPATAAPTATPSTSSTSATSATTSTSSLAAAASVGTTATAPTARPAATTTVSERRAPLRLASRSIDRGLAQGASAVGAPTPRILDTGTVAVPRRLAVIGVTWAEGTGSGLGLAYRVKRGGQWGPWQDVDVETCGDCADPGAATRAGSEPIAVVGATHVQARLVTRGTAVGDPKLSVIDPGTSSATHARPATPPRATGAASIMGPTGAVPAGDTATRPPGLGAFASTSWGSSGPSGSSAVSSGAAASGTNTSGASGLPAAPPGLPGPRAMPTKREAWGAARSSAARALPVVVGRGITVHHTAGTNRYSAAQVPAVLRGIERFHMRDRGWSDIGYNVLVDRFGRVWEGRYGGIGIPHKGAHASGVNTTYLGVAYIGDSSSAPVPKAAVNSIVDIVAWTAARYGFDPAGTLTLDGRTSPVVPGHYQVGNTRTDCPGTHLRRRLPEIRRRAADGASAYLARARTNARR